MPPAVHPDALDAARAGAGWAFERVYQALAPAVLGYLRAQGAADPEAALQDVFLRAFRRIAGFEGTSAQLRSWVFTIAHNLVVDERRFAGRRPDPVPLDVHTSTPVGDAEDDALDRVGADRVRAILDTLPPDQRDVLLLRLLGDLSGAQIAAALGRSEGAVKALQRRGLDRLRRRLEEIEPEAVPR